MNEHITTTSNKRSSKRSNSVEQGVATSSNKRSNNVEQGATKEASLNKEHREEQQE